MAPSTSLGRWPPMVALAAAMQASHSTPAVAM
ncbi:hypothetical protein SMALA_6220 [Streptomyces malaysiensis subsp. malaysiensis]|nr:hypothetical protein SMALA_6220 [Streptomyces malaysiensis]